MFFQKLYVRIWAAVVLAVAVLTFLVGVAWRMNAEAPLREVVVRNPQGEVIGHGNARRMHPPPPGPGEDHKQAPRSADDRHAGEADEGHERPGHPPPGPPGHMHDEPDDEARGSFGHGPEFIVQLQDGQTVHLHLPRPPRNSWFAPLGFFGTLALVALAVALATYPIVRRLTRRLEDLQAGVERWGQGDLGVRVAAQGEDEVAYLAQRFNHAAARIEALVQSRDALLASQKSLLANASHELRSPLARIRMGLELMGDGSGDAVAQRRPAIERNLQELDMLIDEILLASRLDSKEADVGTFEPVDLVGLAAEECARVQALLQDPPPHLSVPGVSKLLRRALRNLLENANRHGGGEVQLQLRQEAGFAVLEVLDTGPGVPLDLRERIFEPFYRLPGASEKDGGVGLGLALVKSIAQRHGGSVQCSNRPEGGACFSLRLPL
jgi:signal transduction histidine kinase